MNNIKLHTGQYYSPKHIQLIVTIFVQLLSIVSCGMKTGIVLDAPERFDIGTSKDYIEFRHQVQINESSFRGYHIFYKIFDKATATIDTSTVAGINSLLSDFQSNVSSSESKVAQMINTDTFTIYSNYAYLCTIVKNENYRQFDLDEMTSEELGRDYPQVILNQIPNNNIEYDFIIKSTTNITLSSDTKLWYSNQNTSTNIFITQERELFRHYIDSTTNTFEHESFSSTELTNDDKGLPTTINFENGSSYTIVIVFFGFAYGIDVANPIDTVFSDPEYLGAIELTS